MSLMVFKEFKFKSLLPNLCYMNQNIFNLVTSLVLICKVEMKTVANLSHTVAL